MHSAATGHWAQIFFARCSLPLSGAGRMIPMAANAATSCLRLASTCSGNHQLDGKPKQADRFLQARVLSSMVTHRLGPSITRSGASTPYRVGQPANPSCS